MEKIKVNLKKEEDHSYEILIDKGLFGKIGKELKKNPVGNKYVIITDSQVKKIFGEKLLENLREEGIKADLISFSKGERSKNLKIFQKLIKEVYSLGLDRTSAIIALGGGVVGDLAGFVAATYMRGIRYGQVPTTLLAQVDSSVGGKVGINIGKGKNLLGIFFQPKRVFIDPSLLRTLPQKEFLNGIAESIKHAIIKDENFFTFLEKNWKKIKEKDEKILITLIKKNCQIKAKVVEADEKEAGLRRILNYGHTIGHALEEASNYQISHGEAVAIGMVAEGMISHQLNFLEEKELRRQEKLIKKVGLPNKLPKKIEIKKVMKLMEKDKKAIGGKINFVLAKKIGQVFVTDKVSKKIIKEVLRKLK